MRFSITDYSKNPQDKGWGHGWPVDRSADMRRVKADRSGTQVNVHKRIAALVDMLLDDTERRGYKLHPEQCGGFNNRSIKGKNVASRHSWGLAVDLNWNLNPESWDGKVHTNLPSWVPQRWGRYGFAWGGHYQGDHRDPMHLEFMGSPDDADDMTALARRELGHGHTDPPSVEKYVVKNGDTLSSIAARLRIGGGWQALYNLNKAVIGPNPDKIVAGQVLRLP
ncbi:MAG TPA: LysM peptidoglycan-binding domain-containing protein [Actinoplanes sp.]|jgi:nucleoid-associated protein YgaU